MSFLHHSEHDSPPRDIVVYGRAYTPDWNADTPTVNVFKSEQMNSQLATDTKGLPVFIEHDDKYPIGEVVDAYIDESRNLNTFLYISGNDLVNRKLPDTLDPHPMTKKRFYSGLSMGTDVALDQKSKCYTQVVGVKPTEVSLVRNPDRPEANIYDYWIVPRSSTDRDAFVSDLKERFDFHY